MLFTVTTCGTCTWSYTVYDQYTNKNSLVGAILEKAFCCELETVRGCVKLGPLGDGELGKDLLLYHIHCHHLNKKNVHYLSSVGEVDFGSSTSNKLI
jgi:hypothetical protein